jgi:hypothetical protein
MTKKIKQTITEGYVLIKNNSIFSLVAFLIPSVSFAAFGGINTLLTDFKGLIKLALPITFALAILFFFYGIAIYVLRAGDEKAAKEGKSIMVYGVIALFVLSSIWGIVKFIGDNLGIDTTVQNSSISV